VSRFREFTLEKLVISTSSRVKSVRVNGLSQSLPTPLDLAARKSGEGTIEAGRVAAAHRGLFPLAAMRQPRQVSQVEPVCKRTCARSCVQGERLDERDERYRGSTGGDCSEDRLLKIAHAPSDSSHNRSQRRLNVSPAHTTVLQRARARARAYFEY